MMDAFKSTFSPEELAGADFPAFPSTRGCSALENVPGVSARAVLPSSHWESEALKLWRFSLREEAVLRMIMKGTHGCFFVVQQLCRAGTSGYAVSARASTGSGGGGGK